MKTLLALTVFTGLAMASAQAMPFAPDQGSAGMITQVAGGCGVNFHRGPRGGCVRNAPAAVVVTPGAVVVVPKTGRCGGRGQHEVCVVGRGCRMVCN